MDSFYYLSDRRGSNPHSSPSLSSSLHPSITYYFYHITPPVKS